MPLHGEHAARPVTLAWLDAEEAILFRWPGSGDPPVDPSRSGYGPTSRRAIAPPAR